MHYICILLRYAQTSETKIYFQVSKRVQHIFAINKAKTLNKNENYRLHKYTRKDSFLN